MRTIVSKPRGCGTRKQGGMYLVTDPGRLASCGRLPMPLGICPTCSAGLKPARNWTWIVPSQLFRDQPCKSDGKLTAAGSCYGCPLSTMPEGRHGLLWIGHGFYSTPQDWLDEAESMGVSRRIKSIPKGYRPGVTQVFVAHQKGTTVDCHQCGGRGHSCDPDVKLNPLGGWSESDRCEHCDGTGQVQAAAVFSWFRPSRIEYLATPLERMTDRYLNRWYSDLTDGTGEQVKLPYDGRDWYTDSGGDDPDADQIVEWAECMDSMGGLGSPRVKAAQRLRRLRERGVEPVWEVPEQEALPGTSVGVG